MDCSPELFLFAFFCRGRGTFGRLSDPSGRQPPHLFLAVGREQERDWGGGAGRPPAGARRAGPQALVKLAGEEPGEVSN